VSRPDAVPVLCYHGVGESSSRELARWQVSPACLDEQLAYLRETGFQPVACSEFASWLEDTVPVAAPRRPVVVTFDDAFTDFAVAHEILARHRVPATLFVPTAHVSGRASWFRSPGARSARILSWEALADLHEQGIEIGSHGHRHLRLDEIPLGTVRDEVALSRQLLEDKLGTEVKGFAYPFGCHDRNVVRVVAEAGFSYACAVRNMLSGTDEAPFAIARIFPPNDGAGAEFARLVAAGARPRRPGEAFRTKSWRVMRRVRARMSTHP